MNVITLEQMDSIQECIAEQERQQRERAKRRNLFLILEALAKQTGKRRK